MAHFRPFRSIGPIAALARSVAAQRAALLEQVCADFELAFARGSADVAARRGMLAEACRVADALGDGARARLVGWYCGAQLREYRRVFGGGGGDDEAAGLDNVARRFAWFRRALRRHDEEHAAIFPVPWRVGEALARRFCDGTRDDVRGLLQRATGGPGVSLLLSALQETLDFELYLERRFVADVSPSCLLVSFRISSHPIASHRISSHLITSYPAAMSLILSHRIL